MLQDKLSEEVQKQHAGPGENGSPPAPRAEPDLGLLPDADPEAGQAEEDKDRTGLLLERLKALEVTASPTNLSCFYLLSFVLFISTHLLPARSVSSTPLRLLLPLQPPLALLCARPVSQLSESGPGSV